MCLVCQGPVIYGWHTENNCLADNKALDERSAIKTKDSLSSGRHVAAIPSFKNLRNMYSTS